MTLPLVSLNILRRLRRVCHPSPPALPQPPFPGRSARSTPGGLLPYPILRHGASPSGSRAALPQPVLRCAPQGAVARRAACVYTPGEAWALPRRQRKNTTRTGFAVPTLLSL